ncbi:MAG: MBL fold metallo-hydrolase [Caldilineaceae bacterium]
MDITWYGLSCFRLREGGVTIICDPYDKSIGSQVARTRADIVTISHDKPGHNGIDQITGEPKVVRGPGEYETRNVFITGMASYHRQQKDVAPERNVIYFMDFGGFVVGHLGDLGEMPKQSQIDELQLGEVDVLMVPVGGGDTLDPTRAVEAVGMFEPKLLIPMHYQQTNMAAKWIGDLEPVDKFLKELGISAPEPQDTLKITKSSLPEETQVVILNCA